MKNIIPKDLIRLAQTLPCPLYLTGGAVRNFLCGYAVSDFDICAALPYEEFTVHAKKAGFFVDAVYKNSLTAKISAKGGSYEFASFRTEKYARGHTPLEVAFTDDMTEDAKRRDFKCNAVYYDIKNDRYDDPLGGLIDIKNRVISTVTHADKVFCNDGLRLMRLARLSGELGFTADANALSAARQNCGLIRDISAERIYAELNGCLTADTKYSNHGGHYTAIKVLEQIGVLDIILPELTQGRDMPQRSDFHKYDVLEHSLKCALYAPPQIRLAALLHDVGKPYCYLKNGSYHGHDAAGERIARDILNRLKAPNAVKSEVCRLIRLHMYDISMLTKESKLRLFIAENYDVYQKLLMLKQADFSASKDDLSVAPVIGRWESVKEKMLTQSTPFTLRDLAVDGNDAKACGFKGSEIKNVLNVLLKECILNPEKNTKERLIYRLENFKK